MYTGSNTLCVEIRLDNYNKNNGRVPSTYFSIPRYIIVSLLRWKLPRISSILDFYRKHFRIVSKLQLKSIGKATVV